MEGQENTLFKILHGQEVHGAPRETIVFVKSVVIMHRMGRLPYPYSFPGPE